MIGGLGFRCAGYETSPCWLYRFSMQGFGEDDYLIFDCPGQIELYSHVTVFRTLTSYLKRNGWNICAVRVLV